MLLINVGCLGFSPPEWPLRCWVSALPLAQQPSQEQLLPTGQHHCPLVHSLMLLLSPVLLCPSWSWQPSPHFCCCSLLGPSPVVSLQPLQPALLKPFLSALEDLPVMCACRASSPLSCCLTFPSEPFGFSPGFDPCMWPAGIPILLLLSPLCHLEYPSMFCLISVFVKLLAVRQKASPPKFMTFFGPLMLSVFPSMGKENILYCHPPLFFFKPHLVAYGISVSLPGIERGPWQ